jgi:hypothetical protein
MTDTGIPITTFKTSTDVLKPDGKAGCIILFSVIMAKLTKQFIPNIFGTILFRKIFLPPYILILYDISRKKIIDS